MGLAVYANENWVGAHPSLVPCDLSGGKVIMKRSWFRWQGSKNGTWFSHGDMRRAAIARYGVGALDMIASKACSHVLSVILLNSSKYEIMNILDS